MCILFFNNKIKLDKLTDIMSSKINKNIKMDTKISIPEEFVGLVYYKDIFLFTLDSGEYKLDKKEFDKVISKNLRRNKNKKKPNFNFNVHYVTKKELSISYDFKAITSFKQKDKYKITCYYSITNPKLFANELLITWYKTTNTRTIAYINSWFKEFSEYFVRKFDKSRLSDNMFLKEFANKFFKKYGVTIHSISISNNKSNFFETVPTQQKQITNQTIASKIKTLNPSDRYCHKCQAKVVQCSAFCVRCGEKINTNEIKFN